MFVIPRIDQSVADHDVVRAGDRLDLDQGQTVTAQVGWQLVGANPAGRRQDIENVAHARRDHPAPHRTGLSLSHIRTKLVA